VGVPSSPDPSEASPAERFRRLRELGSSSIPIWAALEALPQGRSRLVVLEQVSRGGSVDDGELADWVRDAQRLATLEHPNVARVRDVVIRKEDVAVVSDFVDGVRWGELAAGQPPVSLEIALRVLVDALAGLSAIHNVRDAKREPMKLVHGGLTADCVVVGTDGVSRVVGASRVRSAARQGDAGSAYLAPEVLLGDDAADARADIYSVGVMLWEALSGRPLFPNAKPSAILTALLSGRIPRAEAPKGAPWAAPLVDVASRALSVEPDKRLASAFAMAAELRRVVGVKLASPLRVAALVRAGFAEPVRKRREELERGEVAAREPARAQAEEPPIEVESLSSRPTPPPPSPSLSTTRPPPPAEATATAFDSVPVVMSSEPPTQPRVRVVASATGGAAIATAIAVPAPPLVPRELVATTDAPLSLPTPTRAEPPATPVSSDFASEAPLGMPSRKRVIVYAAFAVPLVVGLVALLTWLGLRGPAPANVTAAVSVPVTTAPPSGSAASAGQKTAPMREAATLAPPEPVVPAATSSSDIPAAPSPAAGSSPPPPITTAKPRPIIKYDPQGI
jgi:serine/threonine protein kinase